MGVYLDSIATYINYKETCNSSYFVDKTLILEEIISKIATTQKYICITRPRRFGKTIMANMIASFFSKGCDAKEIFDELEIAKRDCYLKNLNQYHVIFISFNKMPSKCKSYSQYIERIEKHLKKDLVKAFLNIEIDLDDDVGDILDEIYETDTSNQLIFVFDEWDFIFHRDFATDRDKDDYINFISTLLKDKAYVAFAYMTGILPIAKYSSGSELNMFLEYTMVTKKKYSEYFGFTEEEVDVLYDKYVKITTQPAISREELRIWYNGYKTQTGVRMYNPRSIVSALSDNQLSNYWTSSGPYDEIFYYVNHNVDAVRDDLALMVSGIPVPAKVSEYAAVSMNLRTKNEIFSAMLVYGFLTFDNGYVSIPNKELMDKFDEMLLKESTLGYVYNLARESEKMLKATLSGDTKTMVKILEYAHNTESPLLNYSNEIELTAIVNLVYLQARDYYRIEREGKAGIGYVDFIFYPELDLSADCIILELKVNSTAKEAIQQIKERKYALKFEGKLGENPKYTGRVLAVGIAYDKESKVHECEIEILREKLPSE
jgi:hypothetical protein